MSWTTLDGGRSTWAIPDSKSEKRRLFRDPSEAMPVFLAAGYSTERHCEIHFVVFFFCRSIRAKIIRSSRKFPRCLYVTTKTTDFSAFSSLSVRFHPGKLFRPPRKKRPLSTKLERNRTTICRFLPTPGVI